MLGRDAAADVLLAMEVADVRNNFESLGALTIEIAAAVMCIFPLVGAFVKLPIRKVIGLEMSPAHDQSPLSPFLYREYDLRACQESFRSTQGHKATHSGQHVVVARPWLSICCEATV